MVAAADAAKLAQLAEPLRSQLAALLEEAAGAVGIGSGRRSIEEQIQLRRAHCGTSYYAIWQKPASQCSPPTAPPGRSKHQTGEAADLTGNLTLANALAGKYGLITPVKGERWHFEDDPASGPAVVGLGLQGFDIPGSGALDDIAGKVKSALVDVVEDVTEPLFDRLRRITLVGLLVAGGVTLVVLGAMRGVQKPLVDRTVGYATGKAQEVLAA